MAIPEPGIEVLQVVIMVDYAQTARLTLGGSFETLPGAVSIKGCPNRDVIPTSARNIQESALRDFTMGKLALYSYWCADLKNPFIAQMIAAPSKPGSAPAVPSPGTENTLESHYGPTTAPVMRSSFLARHHPHVDSWPLHSGTCGSRGSQAGEVISSARFV